ncbi:MAG: glycosyltransferase family 39 protein [Gemmatimonadetes bacterium]|nr:glycosyltransferase family 39 protein [Gemmatimonadota bacterium]
MSSRLDELLRRPVVLALGWAGAVVVVALATRHFWIPLDAGTLAQSAERVLRGQLPQRDFGDPYSGLNAVVGALALKVLGVRLPALRVPLVVGFAAWLPGLWLVARRFVEPAAAAGAVALAAVLSVPTYPEAMPTWFSLFAVTWGLWCLLRLLDGGSRGWLAAAGALAGVAVLFKVVGLYFVAATLLALAAHRADGSRLYRGVMVAGVVAFLALLGHLVIPGSGASGVWHFFVPALALGGAVVWRGWHGRAGEAASTGAGLRPLLADGVALALGLTIPVALFLVPYALGGGLAAWFRGVFVLPGRRLQAAASSPGPFWTVVPGMVAVVVVGAATRLQGAGARRAALALAALLALGLALDDALDGGVMSTLWYALRGWIPALVVWGAVAWGLRAGASGATASARGFTSSAGADVASGGRPQDGAAAAAPFPHRPAATVYAVLATAGLWALVEFPYDAPAYFFYVAPLGVLATLAVVGVYRRHAGPVLALLAAMAAFLGAGYGAGVALSSPTLLDLPRGGIRVSTADARVYETLVRDVREHTDGGDLWAGPDAPEVYYLTGLPNPTPTLYEFLDATPPRVADLDTLFAAHDVRVVVLNRKPLFSAPAAADVVTWLYRTFPAGQDVGPFSVRWKETP